MLSVCPSLITAFPAALSERPREIVRVPAIDAARKLRIQRALLLIYDGRAKHALLAPNPVRISGRGDRATLASGSGPD